MSSHERLNLQIKGLKAVAAACLEARHSSKLVRGQQGSFNTRTNLCEGGCSGSGKIISKGRKTAIVGRSEYFQRFEFKSFQHAVSDLLGSFNFWIDRVDYSDKFQAHRRFYPTIVACGSQSKRVRLRHIHCRAILGEEQFKGDCQWLNDLDSEIETSPASEMDQTRHRQRPRVVQS